MTHRVNTRGEPVEERHLFAYVGAWPTPSDKERDAAIALLCERLGVEIWSTNVTNHGNTIVELRDAPKEV